jgi:hypothetical protein
MKENKSIISKKILKKDNKKSIKKNIKKNIKEDQDEFKQKNNKDIKESYLKKNFDLNKNYPEYKKLNLQDNLDNFYEKYGDKFYILYNNKKMKINMIKTPTINNKYFYIMKYKENKNSFDYNLKINFINIFKTENNNYSYIANIEKSNLFSGVELVKIAIKLNDILGTEKTILEDASYIICNNNHNAIDLKLIKLLEYNKSFYMKLGFDFDYHTFSYYYNYSNKKEVLENYNELYKNVIEIKCESVIKELMTIINFIISVIKYTEKYNINDISLIIYKETTIENDSIEYYNKNPSIIENNKNSTLMENNKKNILLKLLKILKQTTILLFILKKNENKEKYLYKFLINLFKKDCSNYSIFIENFLKKKRIDIKFKNNIYQIKTREIFQKFVNMIDNIYFSYTHTF